MYGLNLVYNPDHQQILEHHKELLKRAEQEQLVRPVIATSKHPVAFLRKFLRLGSLIRHTDKTLPIARRTPSAQP